VRSIQTIGGRQHSCRIVNYDVSDRGASGHSSGSGSPDDDHFWIKDPDGWIDDH
jgi:hypothetical protein